MKLKDIYDSLVARLSAAGIESPDVQARHIIEQRTGHRWAEIIARPATLIQNRQSRDIDSDLARRLAGEPLSRIYGAREFYGLTFTIGPDTLDPRPDTETLVNAVLQTFHVKQNPRKSWRILDLGTGSGCILLSLLKEMPESTGIGVDLSEKALNIYLHNIKSLGVNSEENPDANAQSNSEAKAQRRNNAQGGQRAMAVCGNWGAAIGTPFDIIVANPPYIAESVIPTLEKEVRNHDPILALAGGKDGLQAYREIFSDLPRLLKREGRAFFEVGFDQHDSVMRLAGESGLSVEAIHLDIAGRARVVEISRGDK